MKGRSSEVGAAVFVQWWTRPSPLCRGLLSSCSASDETLMKRANMCLSTGSAVTLSAEYCVSSYKHLLWRVQGPVFAEHLFSQMILLLSPARSHQSWVRIGPPPLLSTLLTSSSSSCVLQCPSLQQAVCDPCHNQELYKQNKK